jgi:hypothetical protein
MSGISVGEATLKQRMLIDFKQKFINAGMSAEDVTTMLTPVAGTPIVLNYADTIFGAVAKAVADEINGQPIPPDPIP